MSVLTNIPVPPENGDSEVETGLVVQQIAAQSNYTKEYEDSLVAELYSKKRGKENLNLPYGMYVELPPGGRIDINQFAYEYLSELSSKSIDARTFLWSKDFGRVAIGISNRKPINKRICTFAEKDDDEAKSFKIISGTANLNPSNIITQNPQECGSNLIVLNNQTTSIDALFITLTHMIDELVYERTMLIAGSEYKMNSQYYRTAINLILQEGITLGFADTEYILSQYVEFPDLDVRIYGSGNPHVPKVMGYVSNNRFSEAFNLQCLNQLKFPETITAERIEVDDYEVIISITTAKQIHAGHILLYLIANSVAKVFESKVTIIANNTGPRVAQSILALRNKLRSEGLEVTLESTRRILSQMSLLEVESIYQNRVDDDSSDEVRYLTNSLLNNQDDPTLQIATQENLMILNQMGISPNLVYDSNTDALNAISSSFSNSPGFMPEMGLGFTNFESGQASIYMEQGLPTATGITMSDIRMVAKLDSNPKGVVFIDQGQATILGSKLVSEKIGIPAYQAAGAAIGFGGEIASGTKGNSITATQFKGIIHQIGSHLEIPEESLNETVLNALTVKLFNSVFISIKHPNEPGADTFYDFADNNSFCKFLLESTLEYMQMQSKLDCISQYLEGGGTFDFADTGISLNKKDLLGKTVGIINMKKETLLHKISQCGVLPANKVEESMFAEKGYSQEDVNIFMDKVQKKELFVGRRQHPYITFFLALNQLNKSDLDSLSDHEKSALQQAILIIKKVV